MRKIIVYPLIAVLLTALVIILCMGYQRDNAITAQNEKVVELIRPYQNELYNIRMELSKQERASVYIPDESSLLIGFVPVTKDDVLEIMSLTENHSFRPVVILDCEEEISALLDIIVALDSTRLEVALMGTSDSDEIINKANILRNAMFQYGFLEPVAFMMRGSSYAVSALNHIYGLGFTPIIRYNDSLASGISGNGIPCLAYGMLSDGNDYSEIISRIVNAKSVVLIGYDFKRLKNGELSRKTITNGLDAFDQQVNYSRITYCTIAEAQNTVLYIDNRNKELDEEFADYSQTCQARISELEDIIRNIYAQYKWPYNPPETKDTDTRTSADDRQVGGLVIFLFRKLTDDMSYRYVNEATVTINK